MPKHAAELIAQNLHIVVEICAYKQSIRAKSEPQSSDLTYNADV